MSDPRFKFETCPYCGEKWHLKEHCPTLELEPSPRACAEADALKEVERQITLLKEHPKRPVEFLVEAVAQWERYRE